nr:hypothetical protein CFP56_16490 [Quercus suber]
MDSRGPGALLRLSKSGEDVANGLITFREALPQHAVRITAMVEQLFALSTILQELHLAQRDRRYEPSFHRIRQDLSLVQTSLEITLHACFEMFGRTSLGRSYEMVWGDLQYRMRREEHHGLFERLEIYVAFLTALRCIITETPAEDLRPLRDMIGDLVEVQSLAAYQEPGVTDLTRQRSSRGRRRRSGTRASPAPSRPASVVYANGMSPDPYARRTPPEVPYAPYHIPEPFSPAFTSGSSEPLMSSYTSYSEDQFYAAPSLPNVHWAVEVFDGSNPSHAFRGNSQS